MRCNLSALFLPCLLVHPRDDMAVVDALNGRAGQQRGREIESVRGSLMLKTIGVLAFALATIHTVKIESESAG